MRRNKAALCVLSILMCAVMYVAPIKVNAEDSTCTYRRYNGVKYVPATGFWSPETSPGAGGHWDYYGTCPDCGRRFHCRRGYNEPPCGSFYHECYITVRTTHAWSEWSVYQPATCTTNSKSRRSCSRCGAVENRENTNASLGPVAFGHDYKVTDCTYPDSVNPGSITFVCQNDPSHTVTNAITLGDWNIYFKERRVQKVALGDKLLNLLYVGDTPLRSYVENGVDPITGERNRVLH